MNDCLFCKIADKKIPSEVVYEDDEFVAFNDINPAAKTHILIIPKKHIDSIIEIDESQEDDALIGRLILTARNIAKNKGLTGYKLQFHVGKDGGQIIFHIHLHLMSNQG